MLRTALRPRLVGLLVLALVLAGVFVLAGRWQWSVAHDRARADAVREVQQQPVEPLTEVVAPQADFPDDGSGQRVTATGEYAGDQFVVRDRLLEGEPGVWVVDRFVVEETGANLAVVRGWIDEGEDPPSPPEGTIEMLGSLAPKEAPDTGDGAADGEMSSVDIATLVNVWPGEIYNGFAFAISEDRRSAISEDGRSAISEDGPKAISDVTRVPPPLPDTSLRLRNVMYAVQWWVFAAFPLWMWTKMVRQAARRDEAVEAEESKEHVA